ncbi:PXA domain-containing protein [Pisolithus tinctorius]|nr:PXA domain-containing protein [Pisolithus tinctorius]
MPAALRRGPPTHSARSTTTASLASTNARQQQQAGLAKRLLFPNTPPGSDLPPLFLSPTCPPELHAEVYDFIALSLRAYVNTWWTKITRYDKEFLPQLTNVLVHVIRVLEQRILSADLSTLVFCDVPALVTEHFIDYRHAASKVSTSYATGGAHTIPQLFHLFQPHLAISPEGNIDEEYFRHALDLVLKICLPPEDYAPDAERYIIREVLLKLIVRDIIPRVTQPWFIQQTVLDLLGPPPEKDVPSQPPHASSSSSHGHFSQLSNLIVLLLSTIQSLSGACLALIHVYKQAISTIKLVNESTATKHPRAANATSNASRPEVPPSKGQKCTIPMSRTSSSSSVPSTNTPERLPEAPHDFIRGPLVMFCEIFRMHWRFSSAVAFNFLFMLCTCFRTFINSFLSYMLYSQVLSFSSMLSLVRLSKRTLFPNGYPGPPPVDPTPEEQAMIRRLLIRRVSEMLPVPVSTILLGSSPVASLEAVIDPLSDNTCNIHLVVFLFDAVLLTVFPELGMQGSSSKMETVSPGVLSESLEGGEGDVESIAEDMPTPSSLVDKY